MRTTAAILRLLLATSMCSLQVEAANSPSPAGTLACTTPGGWTQALHSPRSLSCIFRQANGAAQRYRALVTGAGVELGYVKTLSMTWSVFGPAPNAAPNVLAGDYNPEGGASKRISNPARSISLEPRGPSEKGQAIVSVRLIYAS
jgi:hypothetical protein